jgi:hypothetical protein
MAANTNFFGYLLGFARLKLILDKNITAGQAANPSKNTMHLQKNIYHLPESIC